MDTGPEVTAQCLKCHEKHAEDFMKTTHWTWAQDQLVGDKNVVRGKKNAINNFCTSIAGNWTDGNTGDRFVSSTAAARCGY